MDHDAAFDRLAAENWKPVFADPGDGDWTERWFRDGQKATISNTPAGMEIACPPVSPWDDAFHEVLWTRQSFEGKLKIDYEYTKLDDALVNVTIIYVQATGAGDEDHPKDIADWADQRRVPAMRQYFNHMHCWHVSYAAYPMDNPENDPDTDYIRARRYNATELKGTELAGEAAATGLFQPGVPHQISIIAGGDELAMRVKHPDKTITLAWRCENEPPITEGHIGLRHMFARAARYKDFTVSRPG